MNVSHIIFDLGEQVADPALCYIFLRFCKSHENYIIIVIMNILPLVSLFSFQDTVHWEKKLQLVHEWQTYS